MKMWEQNIIIPTRFEKTNIPKVEVIKLGHEVNVFFLDLNDVMDGDS